MKLLQTSTTDEKELLKAATTKKNFKEMLTGEIFSPQEILIFQDDKGEESAVYAAVKINGKYYKGVAGDVIDTCLGILDWAESAGYDDMRELQMHFEKSSGKYGKIRLELD